MLRPLRRSTLPTDPYRAPHKALRTALGRLLEHAGRTDFGDVASIGAFRVELEAVVQLLTTHARIEVQFVDPLLGSHEVEIASSIQHDHRALERKLHEVCGALHVIDELLGENGDGDVDEGRDRGHAFYLALSRFVAEYLVHIADEEERALPALRRHVGEGELAQTLDRARETVDPGEWAKNWALVLTSASHHERVALLAASGLPELRQIARIALTEEEWRELAIELG